MSQSDTAYRERLEEEIKKWAGYERALRGEDRQFFQELMNMARSYAPEASCAENRFVFQPMAMSIILALNNSMKKIEEELSRIKPPKQTTPQAQDEKPVEAVVAQPKPAGKKPQRGLLDFG